MTTAIESTETPPRLDGTGHLAPHTVRGHASPQGVDAERVPATGLASWIAGFSKLAVAYRVPTVLTAHAAIFAALYLGSYGLRFDGEVPADQWNGALRALPWVVAVKLAVLVARGGHRGLWRYVNFADVALLFEISLLSAAVIALASWALPGGFHPPRSVVLIDAAGTLLALGGLRSMVRLTRESYSPAVPRRDADPALIVGANDAGVALVRELLAHPGLGVRPVGILDSNPVLRGMTLAGVPVLGCTTDLATIAQKRGVRAVLIPTPATPARMISDLVAACNAVGLKPRVVPGFDALLSDRLVVKPRDVALGDLLGRPPVALDDSSLATFLHGKTVMVTGAAGSIGSEVCRQVLRFRPSALVLYDHSETGLFHADRELNGLVQPGTRIIPYVGNVTDKARLRAVMTRYRPAVVFHAAALKHVPMMEDHPGEAIKTNALGTRRVADAALDAGAEAFLLVSTDKAVRPSSVMGATKRLAEAYVQSLAGRSTTRMLTVRFGNVLGSNGSVVPIFQEQVRRGGPVTVTHPEMTRYFMTIPEAAQLVLQAGALGRGGEIFVLDMGTPVRVADLARDVIRLAGLTEGAEIEVVYTGLRPGEKLHEELYEESETRLPTPHPKIFAAAPGGATRTPDLASALDRLLALIEADAPPRLLIEGLAQLVPGYRPAPAAEARSGADQGIGIGAEGFEQCPEPVGLPS
ncbi:MAG: polysaccharide biosynthesis protein [Isosphaeraceae bacterium]